MRKAISILVLLCMTLHGLSRLEVISYVYSHRHELSYALGISAERAIAVCKGNYFQDTRLNQQKENSQLPSGLPIAQEIILASPSNVICTSEISYIIVLKSLVTYSVKEYPLPTINIFHPPLS